MALVGSWQKHASALGGGLGCVETTRRSEDRDPSMANKNDVTKGTKNEVSVITV
jgi:hypothetical protein